jgi:hypothetical protein
LSARPVGERDGRRRFGGRPDGCCLLGDQLSGPFRAVATGQSFETSLPPAPLPVFDAMEPHAGLGLERAQQRSLRQQQQSPRGHAKPASTRMGRRTSCTLSCSIGRKTDGSLEVSVSLHSANCPPSGPARAQADATRFR